MRSTSVRAIIVDQERLFAEALELLLRSNGITIEAIASPGPDLLDVVRRGRPDVVIVGVDAPTAADVRRARAVIDAMRTTQVLLVASRLDRTTSLMLSRAGLQCIPKHASVEHLVQAILSLASGRLLPRYGYAPTGVDGSVRGAIGQTNPPLTPRELEVLTLVATGATGRSIARRLGVTENTVRTHSQSILEKLRVHSRLEAAAYAMRNGLVRLGSLGTDGLAS